MIDDRTVLAWCENVGTFSASAAARATKSATESRRPIIFDFDREFGQIALPCRGEMKDNPGRFRSPLNGFRSAQQTKKRWKLDALRVALRRFEQLAVEMRRGVTPELTAEVESWLENFVCPVGIKLFANTHFRESARWSADRLAIGSTAVERKDVEAVDAALVALAAEISRGERQAGPGLGSGNENMKDEAAGKTPSPAWLSERPWFDLVACEDYFGSVQSMMLSVSSRQLQEAFFRAPDPRVPLGDYICRSMFRRIACLKNVLDRPARLLLQDHLSFDRILKATTDLDLAIEKLRLTCSRGDQGKQRDACCTLVQIVVAYEAGPDLSWLGWPCPISTADAGSIRSQMMPIGDVMVVEPAGRGTYKLLERHRAPLILPEVFASVGNALANVERFFRRPVEIDDVEETIRFRFRLVVIDRAVPAVYWDGELIDVAWNNFEVVWDLLRALALRARSGKAVESEDLARPKEKRRHSVAAQKPKGPRRATPITHRRSRLSNLLPPDLDKLIENVPGTGAYRLKLPASQIAVLRTDDEFGLVAVEPELLAAIS